MKKPTANKIEHTIPQGPIKNEKKTFDNIGTCFESIVEGIPIQGEANGEHLSCCMQNQIEELKNIYL